MGKGTTFMKVILDGREYAISLEDNTLTKEIAALCPMELSMSRSGGHEYYGTLSGKLDAKQARQTSVVQAGGVYYFAAWNAFSLVFRAADIPPYSVHIVGQAEDSLTEALLNTGRSIAVRFEEEA